MSSKTQSYSRTWKRVRICTPINLASEFEKRYLYNTMPITYGKADENSKIGKSFITLEISKLAQFGCSSCTTRLAFNILGCAREGGTGIFTKGLRPLYFMISYIPVIKSNLYNKFKDFIHKFIISNTLWSSTPCPSISSNSSQVLAGP